LELKDIKIQLENKQVENQALIKDKEELEIKLLKNENEKLKEAIKIQTDFEKKNLQ
jgi:hypothetical protein